MQSLQQLVLGRWREFCREPSALIFVVLMPMIWMASLGFIFSTPNSPNYRIGAEDRPEVRAMLAPAVQVQDKSLTLYWGTKAEIEEALKHGKVQVGVTVREGEMIPTFLLDVQNSEALGAKLYLRALLNEQPSRGEPAYRQEHIEPVNGRRYIDFLVPGILAFSFLTTSLFGTGMTIVANRRENLLKRYMATPMSGTNYLLSHIIGRILIMAVELVVIMASAWVMFGVYPEGRWFEILLFSALAVMTFALLGILCGSRMKNHSAYHGICNLLMLPMMLLGGVWFSIDQLPLWVLSFARSLPLTLAVDGLRSLINDGKTLVEIPYHVAGLAAYGFVFFVVAIKAFRWY